MMLKPGTYLQDRYEILSLIGTGGMSEVYQAKCHTLNRLVAIKVLKPGCEFRQQIQDGGAGGSRAFPSKYCECL